MRLSVSEKAPDFELSDERGSLVSLSDYHGMWVLLYFYPRDNTPGCTQDAEALLNLHDSLSRRDVVVLGVSVYSPQSLLKFREKYRLSTTLLADEDKEVCELYSALNAGRNCPKRTSFLVDSDGLIAKIYNIVKPEQYAKEILADVVELQKL